MLEVEAERGHSHTLFYGVDRSELRMCLGESLFCWARATAIFRSVTKVNVEAFLDKIPTAPVLQGPAYFLATPGVRTAKCILSCLPHALNTLASHSVCDEGGRFVIVVRFLYA